MSQAVVLVIGLTVCLYWFCVGAMILRVRRQARGVRRVLIPAQWTERAMWVIWIPVVLGWMTIPFLSVSSLAAGGTWIGVPTIVSSSVVLLGVRAAAALVGMICLLLSIWCWHHMGRDWRMGIDPAQKSRLLVTGPFTKVRHPIYALSILLMLCTVVVLPAPAMALLAGIHIGLMLLKARNEERFLLGRHGQAYADYMARTGRFVPPIAWGRKLSGDQPVGGVDSPEAGRPPQTGPAFSRLNSFQEAMLLWEEAYPYNAVHALRVSGPADVPALRRIIEHECRRAGIGELEIDRENRCYRYLELKDVPLAELPPSARPEETLAQVINEGMNARFPDGPAHPLRWSVFDEADHSAHHIVVAYRHIASDATGLEMLLARILRRYRGSDDAGVDAPLMPVPSPEGSCRTTEGSSRIGFSRFLRGVAFYFRFRHMHKMPDERDMGDETAVAIRPVPDAVFNDLSAACKARGVGLNDACLAALASAIAERTPHRRNRRHRHKMALGTVASTRRRVPAGLDGHFNVQLSDRVIFLNSPDAPLDQLLPRIAAQTRRLKTNLDPRDAASAMQSFFIGRIWPMLDIPNHRRSYRKLLPICGGVSSFAVDVGRFGAAAADITRYLRACPPGPAIPLVLAPTIFNGRLEISLVYRLSCLPPVKAEELLNDTYERLLLLIHAAC